MIQWEKDILQSLKHYFTAVSSVDCQMKNLHLTEVIYMYSTWWTYY